MKIFRISPLLFAIAMFSITLYSQGQNNSQSEEQIKVIRSKFTEINTAGSLKTCVVKVLDLEGESTEGGQAKAYFIEDKIGKTSVEYFGETGKLYTEFYYSENQLIFCFVKKTNYDLPISVEGSKEIESIEDRFYFSDNKMIRWLKNDKSKANLSTQESKDKELEILKDSKEIYDKF